MLCTQRLRSASSVHVGLHIATPTPAKMYTVRRSACLAWAVRGSVWDSGAWEVVRGRIKLIEFRVGIQAPTGRSSGVALA